MDSLTALILSFALMGVAPSTGREDVANSAPVQKDLSVAGMRSLPDAYSVFIEAIAPDGQNQVRIEQRVIIRIAPSPPAAREEMLSRLPRREMTTEYREVKDERCLPIGAIAGVAPVDSNRLLLFMRDQRVLSASLEKACDAQAFYSGFYVERSEDGMVCSGRDQLRSRAGTLCEVDQFNRLVAVRD